MTWVQTPVARQMAWALLHFVWQGAAIGITAAALLWLLRRSTANVRYVVACCALLMMFAAVIATAVWMPQRSQQLLNTTNGEHSLVSYVTDLPPVSYVGAGLPPPREALRRDLDEARRAESGQVGPLRPDLKVGDRLAALAESALPWVLLAWSAGVSALSIRLAFAWLLATRLRRRGVTPVSAVAANGGSLLVRVRRLLDAPAPGSERAPAWLACIAVVSAIALGSGAWASALDDERLRMVASASTDILLTARTSQGARTTAHTEPLRVGGAAITLAIDGEQPPEPRPPAPPAPPQPPAPLGDTIAPLPPYVPAPVAPPAPPTSPAPSAAPAPPARPAPPAPPAPAAVQEKWSGETTINWDDGRNTIRMRSRGRIELNDDDTDVKSISDGGYLELEVRSGSDRHRVEIRDVAGRLERTWFVDGRERPWGADAQAWLARQLPGFVRRSGIAAESRVKRILAAKGVNGVLAEISFIDSDWAKRVYFTRLLEQATIDAAAARRILEQAGKEIKSDFELASLLTPMAPRTANDPAARLAYVEATTKIGSDFERRRALTALVKQGNLTPEVTKAALQSAGKMSSDFELASFLIAILDGGRLDAAAQIEFINAIATIQSDFERRRALSALIKTGGASTDTLTRALRAAASMSSNFELAEFLTSVAAAYKVDDVRQPFFAAVDTIGSDFERRRALSAVVKATNVSRDTLIAAIESAARMSSDFELASFLIALARQHTIDEPVKSAYIKAADRIRSDFEQDRALAALVRR